MKNLYIHIGLHKTASTFLQKNFFTLYSKECGYVQIRNNLKSFLEYILHRNDFEFNMEEAKDLFYNNIGHENGVSHTLTLSDEQFCGSPWNNAKDRKRYFDRLNSIFPSAKYVIVFRNQEEMTESLYLQYVKRGGSANWEKFIAHKRHPLEFSGKSYLNYGDYLQYIVEQVGRERVLCLFYEDMKTNLIEFLVEISTFIGFDIDHRVESIVGKKENLSLPGSVLKIVIYFNKIFSSTRQPFLLFPSSLRNVLLSFLIYVLPVKRKMVIEKQTLKQFCIEPKKKNYILEKITGRKLKNVGY